MKGAKRPIFILCMGCKVTKDSEVSSQAYFCPYAADMPGIQDMRSAAAITCSLSSDLMHSLTSEIQITEFREVR